MILFLLSGVRHRWTRIRGEHPPTRASPRGLPYMFAKFFLGHPDWSNGDLIKKVLLLYIVLLSFQTTRFSYFIFLNEREVCFQVPTKQSFRESLKAKVYIWMGKKFVPHISQTWKRVLNRRLNEKGTSIDSIIAL